MSESKWKDEYLADLERNDESPSGGVKSITLGRRLTSERERLIGMTDEERAWRKKYLQSQILDHDEPRYPENFYKQRYNAIRRFYRYPMDQVENALSKMLNPTKAYVIRHIIAKSAFILLGTYVTWYHVKYNQHHWTDVGGWRIAESRVKMYPGDPNYPNWDKRTEGKLFAVHDFDKSAI